MSVFDKRSEVANCRNRKFTAKSIRNNVWLYRKVQNTVDPATKMIPKLLDENENQWATNQRKACKERIKFKFQKAVNLKVMVMRLLSDCKSWGGPATSAEEILEVLKRNPDKQKFILRTELAYFTHTNKTEKIQRPDLFRQNVISFEEKLESFCILLSDDAETCTATIANLTTNGDGIKALATKETTAAEIRSPSTFEVNQMCVVFWLESEAFTWYIGYISEVNEENYVVDYLHQNPLKQNEHWHYPRTSDKQIVLPDQMVDIEEKGDWTLEERNQKFVLTNEKDIIFKFKETVPKMK